MAISRVDEVKSSLAIHRSIDRVNKAIQDPLSASDPLTASGFRDIVFVSFGNPFVRQALELLEAVDFEMRHDVCNK